MSKKDCVYIARLLNESDMGAAKKLASESKEKKRRLITKDDVLGGSIRNVQISSVDTRNMIDENGAFFFYADNIPELQEAIEVLKKQPKDPFAFLNREAGIANENDTFGGGRQKVLYAAVPGDRFYKFAESGKYISTGEGEYVDEDDNAYFLNEAVVGMSALKLWNITGVKFEMKTVNSFLGKSGQSSEYFIAKNLRENAENDTFVQNGWGKGNSGNDGNEM